MNLEQLKFPIGQFEKPNEISIDVLSQWITVIEEFPNKIKSITNSLSVEELNRNYRPNGWNIKQVVHHCADSHMNSFIRFKLALTEENPTIKPYEEALWANLIDGNNDNILSSLQIIEGIHAKWSQLLKSLQEEELNRTFHHPESNKKYILKEVIGIYTWHCNHHFAHIEQALLHNKQFSIMKNISLLSERTELKLIDFSDLEFIHELHSLPETDQYNALGIPKDIEETKLVIKPWIEENLKEEITNYTFLIEENQSKNPIGLFGIKLGNKKYKRAEIWYKIHSDYWNKGYATEVLNTVLTYCFEELKLHRIQAGCAVENIGSIKVLEKVGFILEGRCRQILPLKNGWSDNFEYAILESDVRKKSCKVSKTL